MHLLVDVASSLENAAPFSYSILELTRSIECAPYRACGRRWNSSLQCNNVPRERACSIYSRMEYF